jgi:hypothetical protein
MQSYLPSSLTKTLNTKPPTTHITPSLVYLPPSDFKDLVLTIQIHFSAFDAYNSCPSATQCEQNLAVLLQQSRAIDAHYGCVLASDVTMVARMFAKDEDRAREWVKMMAGKVEGIRETLEKSMNDGL